MVSDIEANGFGSSTLSVDDELKGVLCDAPGRLGETATLYFDGTTSPTEIANRGGAASAGAASNLIASINAVMYGALPKSASKATATASTVNSLIKNNDLSQAAQQRLNTLGAKLKDVSNSAAAQDESIQEAVATSDELEKEIRTGVGVYVYTYPHYFNHPYRADSNQILLKVGCTKVDALKRIGDQVRQTAAPEDPLFLRLYLTDTPEAAEKQFHALLDAAQHARSGKGKHAGKEWFCTSLDFLDEVAKVLGLEALTDQSSATR